MSTITETADVQRFIGKMSASEFRATMPGDTFIEPHVSNVRVTMSDGSVRDYIGRWSRRVSEDGTQTMTELGEHFYALSGTGELHIVMVWTVTHYDAGGSWKEIITDESVVVTFAAHAWITAEGPRGDAPEKDRQERKYPETGE